MARTMDPMKPECRSVISRVLGREFGEEESKRWLADMRREFRYVAGTKEAQAAGWTRDQIAQKAAERLAQNYLHKAAKRRIRAQQQIVAQAALENNREKYVRNGEKAFKSVGRVLEDVNRYVIGLEEQYQGQMVKAISSIQSKWLGLMEDRDTALAFVKECFGEDTGNKAAKDAARVWREVSNEWRQRFNNAGGDVGDLGDDWHMPQSHDSYKVLKAQKLVEKNEKYRDKYKGDDKTVWVDFLFDRIDKSRYVDDEGIPLNDAEIKDVLGSMYENITGGKTATGASRVAGSRSGCFADKHAKHRAIFFKDAESFFQYHEIFARNPSIVGTMLGHARSMASDTALLEQMGPSPNTAFNTLYKEAAEEAAEFKRATKSTKGHKDMYGPGFVSVKDMWSNLNGETSTIIPNHEGIAEVSQTLRNMQVWGKLGQAFISSLTDIPSYFHATGYTKLPWGTAFRNILTTWGKSDREFATRAGIIGDTLANSLCRWTSESVGYRWSGKLANATMYMSLLTQWTNGIRRAYAMNMMGAIGKITRNKDWGNLDAWDRFILEKYDITEKDYKLFQLAKTDNYRGCEMLTRGAIEEISDADLAKIGATRNDAYIAAGKLMSVLTNEAQIASLQPDLATRTASNRGHKRGDPTGEVIKSFMMFKSFPLGMVSAHIDRLRDKGRFIREQGGTKRQVMAAQSQYLATLIIGTTLMGYCVNQIKTLIAGKDLEDPAAIDTWISAFTVGGGAGIIGDLLVNATDDSKYGHSAYINFMGPVIGTILSASETWDATKIGGDGGAKAWRLAKSNLPFINIWYVKAVLDHTVLNQLSEFLSPGYRKRMEKNTRKRTGQGFWRNERGIRRAPRVAKHPDPWPHPFGLFK